MGDIIQLQTTLTLISLSFFPQQTLSDTYTLPPQISCVTFLDKQRPWRMLEVCAHNVWGVCMCVFVHTEFAALCSRGRKSQDDGDFKTGLQLLRKPVHCMFSFLLPSACAPFLVCLF